MAHVLYRGAGADREPAERTKFGDMDSLSQIDLSHVNMMIYDI